MPIDIGFLQKMGATGPEAIQTLKQQIQRFEDTVQDTQPRWFQARAEGAWTPAQITEHVVLVSEIFSKVLYLLQLPEMPELPKQAGVYREGKMQSPAQGIPGEGMEWEALKPKWDTVHQKLVTMAERVQDWSSPQTVPHPFFGDFTTLQWVQIAAYHLIHHRRQMLEVPALA